MPHLCLEMQEEDGAAQTIPAVSPTLLQHPQELGAPFIPVSSFFSLIYNLNETSAQKFYIYIISQDTEQCRGGGLQAVAT